jgi:hypothetical protein
VIRRLSVPVVSVGNLTVAEPEDPPGDSPGGVPERAGKKTGDPEPRLRRPAQGPVEVVSDGRLVLSEPAVCGDEPFMMARRLHGVPVLTGRSGT